MQDIRIKRDSQGVLLFFLFFATVVSQFASVFSQIFESHDPSANIISPGDALWWSFVTVGTAGYGDKYPITAGGRVVALLLMIVGIAMLGIFTSTLSDWFRRPPRRRHKQEENKSSERAVTLAEMQHLLDQQSGILQRQIDELEHRISKKEVSRR